MDDYTFRQFYQKLIGHYALSPDMAQAVLQRILNQLAEKDTHHEIS